MTGGLFTKKKNININDTGRLTGGVQLRFYGVRKSNKNNKRIRYISIVSHVRMRNEYKLCAYVMRIVHQIVCEPTREYTRTGSDRTSFFFP